MRQRAATRLQQDTLLQQQPHGGAVVSAHARGYSVDRGAAELHVRALHVGALGERRIDEPLVRKSILVRVQEDAARRPAVATRAAGFLIVRLQRPRHGVVQDEPHIRLVDAHAEGIGRDDGVHGAAHEAILHVTPMFVVEPCMIWKRGHAPPGELRRQPLDGTACCRVHDGGTFVTPESREQGVVLVAVVAAARDGIVQVLAIEALDDHPWRPQAQLPGDVRAYRRRRRGGQRDRLRTPDLRGHVGNAAEARAEVVAPFADAVCLVHREEGDASRQRALQVRGLEAFWREIEQPELPSDNPADALAHLCRVERAVEECGRDAAACEPVDLVFHQGDERRDHHGQAARDQRRDLVTDGFATARGQYGKRVATGEHALDDGQLRRPEVGIAEEPLQDFTRIFQCRRHAARVRRHRRRRGMKRAPGVPYSSGGGLRG